MRLKNYFPVGHQILVELKEWKTTPAGLILPKPEADKIMKVLKVGSLVDVIKAGDYVLIDGTPLMQLEFEPEIKGGKPIVALQGKDFNIVSIYVPDADEDKYFPTLGTGAPLESEAEEPRMLNILPGTDTKKSQYLKEELSNQKIFK